ncbi:hypothetical protein QOZ80_5AG0391390 [Eleusine coracana subsp. coracana]|nr:hypothetical protein QOZ80_5AG0391390 [Eleusine coracana subsp. coracana]
MGRSRVEVRRIENAVSRQVTFSKRRRGLAKKAQELAVLCDADVAMLVFSDKGRLHHFAVHASVDQILDRYERYLLSEAGDVREEHPFQLQENMSYDNIKLMSRIEALQRSERNLMGEQLDALTLREVQQLQQQIEAALRNIRSRKDSILLNSIRELQKKEWLLMEQKSALEKEKAELDTYPHNNSTASSIVAAPLLDLNTCCTDDSDESQDRRWRHRE